MSFTLWIVSVLFLTVQGSDAGQAPSPDALVSGYVTAFNAGEQPMREFLRAHADPAFSLDAAMERYRRMKGDMGTLSLRSVAARELEAFTAEMTTERGLAAVFIFQLTMDGPPRIRGISVRLTMGDRAAGEQPAGPPLGPRDEADALVDLDALLKKATAADEFSGAVLLARDGRVVWERAVGQADREKKIANTIDTKFNLGSIGKHFTSVAVAQLVADGRIRPNDTVGRFLPDYPNAIVREKVTVQMLLDMRSGIGDFFGPKYDETPKSRLRSLEDYLPLFAGEPLLFEPGQGNRYSNGGYVVLGLIVRKASGKDYYDYVRERVFEPAKMPTTGFYLQSAPVPNRAHGYTMRLGPPRRLNTDTLPERASSAGGVYSTLHDLLAYSRALAAGRLVSPEAMKKIGRGVAALGIAGGAPGLNATLDTEVNGYTLIVLSNYDPPAAERLSRDARRVVVSIKRVW